MWDPSILPSCTQSVGNLHEEIEKLASLFSTPPLDSRTNVDDLMSDSLVVPYLSEQFPHGTKSRVHYDPYTCYQPQWAPPICENGATIPVVPATPSHPFSDNHPATFKQSILNNWKPQTLRETELLLIIDDLQNKLRKERDKHCILEHLNQTVIELRRALDISHASEKFYKLKLLKLETQSSVATRKTTRHPTGGFDGRPGRLRTSETGRLPFSRTAERRRLSRSTSTVPGIKRPLEPAEPNFQFPPLLGSSRSNFSSCAVEPSAERQNFLFEAPAVDPLAWRTPFESGGATLSDSGLHCRSISAEAPSVLTMSANVRRRSSSANRVREVMQSIGFLSARSDRQSKLPPFEQISLINAPFEPSSTTAASPSSSLSHQSRLGLPSSSATCPRLLATIDGTQNHQNVAQAIANERHRQIAQSRPGEGTWNGTMSPSGTPTPLAEHRRINRYADVRSSSDTAPQVDPPPSNNALHPPSGPLDIDQRLCSLRRLIQQATAPRTHL